MGKNTALKVSITQRGPSAGDARRMGAYGQEKGPQGEGSEGRPCRARDQGGGGIGTGV